MLFFSQEGMFMPMNINGIPYTTDYMQYYRPPSHQVGVKYFNYYNKLYYTKFITNFRKTDILMMIMMMNL